MGSLSVEDDSFDGADENIDRVKQFKKNVFKPFFRNPYLNRESSLWDHSKHAFHALVGKHSDHMKFPFNLSPTWGIMVQHLKVSKDPTFHSVTSFLKSVTFKTQLESGQPNINKDYCAVTEAIKHEHDINQIENHFGLLDFPFLLNILATGSIQFSQYLQNHLTEKKRAAESPHNNKSPVLDFLTNIFSRMNNTEPDLKHAVRVTYKILEIAFYFTVRFWLESATFIVAPLWDVVKAVLVPVILFISFPIWYPIAKYIYNVDPQPNDDSTQENIVFEEDALNTTPDEYFSSIEASGDEEDNNPPSPK